MSAVARRAVLAFARRFVHDRLDIVDGSKRHRFGTDAPDAAGRPALHGEMIVRDERAWAKVLTGGSAGLGEAYFEGWWDTDDLTTVLRILHRATRRTDPHRTAMQRVTGPVTDSARRFRRQNRDRDRANIRAHYDLGNEFFEHFLDPTMMYSSAIFPSPSATLEEASLEKLDRMCRLIGLRPGDRVLEIGTGWGGFSIHAAGRFGAEVTTTTISAEQYALASERVARAGLSDRVTILHDDYRDLSGQWDKLVSIEMIEAVDWREYDTYFGTCQRLLRPDGIMGLQAIVIEDQRYERAKNTEDFIKAFIFPGGCLPSVGAIMRTITRVTDFSVTSLSDHGADYAETLRRWRTNLHTDEHRLAALGLDDRFVRMWDFYLCYCECGFTERSVSVVQMALARAGWRPTGC